MVRSVLEYVFPPCLLAFSLEGDHAANNVTNKLRFAPTFSTAKLPFHAADVALHIPVFRYAGVTTHLRALVGKLGVDAFAWQFNLNKAVWVAPTLAAKQLKTPTSVYPTSVLNPHDDL